MAVYANYKPARELGKGFLHRDITGERCGLGCGRGVKKESNNSNYQITKPYHLMERTGRTLR